ncbi:MULTISPECIES: winged helix-turn-helix domain-containing protein [Micromonospora]|uniref:winged helix-turn-helix domain-containing protein n=1 Tax=Micromonospora TaxID=1873 RepID=UPI0011524D18|nr:MULTISPECIES: winged helix-turn-helix domain-containing protein [unclassified Micromonospora]MBQ0980717.1 winged helix-turn-helix transcriptional regulator [Micromonospora sp. M61]TQJ22374.1 helix-turn-helix protein [Micromonospora sp. A202]WTI23555.1 winged helix-turn-helix domain-containing protein [Micromonospora zamorensis]
MELNEPERRLRVRDATKLRALAHPLRLRLLRYLLAAGPRTAAQCAEALNDTGSNCSYHLHQLARHGLIERDHSDGTNRRDRPWRAAATGLEFLPDPDDAEGRQLNEALTALEFDEVFRSLQRYQHQQHKLTDEWQESATFHSYTLSLNPEELRHLALTLDAVIRPYLRPLRNAPPSDARAVTLNLQAYPTPEFI